ncbi:DotI/IcmL family type IV secretion protein, partial [Fangia hongkongensis]
MNQKALKAVVEKSFFYKQNFRALIRILTISIVLNIILLISFVLFLGKQKEQFLAVNTQGQVLALKTSKMPNITQSMLINWVALNITRLYALDFLNYKQQMLSTRILFTNSGWKSFNVAFTPIVDKIVKEKIVQSSVLEGPPVVTAVGLVSGIRSWKLQV